MFLLPHFILYASYFVFPFLLGCLWLWKKNWNRGLLIILIIFSVLFIDARFIETNIVSGHVHTFTIDESASETIRVVVYGDMHIGTYRSAEKLQKDVQVINDLEPDVILIVGDFIQEGIQIDELGDAFSAYQNLHAPAYAVSGNHDSEQPGHIPVQHVRDAVEKNGVNIIDNKMQDIVIRGKELRLVGLSDIWGGETNYELVQSIQDEHNSIVLVHNPDAVFNISRSPIDLVVSGHTHAGQIRIPYVYDQFIPTGYPFYHGWYEFDDTSVFITAGTGYSGLPMRFFFFFAVDAIDIRL